MASSAISVLSKTLGEVLYGGIDSNIPGHGGEECTNYLDRNLMVLDTSIGERHFQSNITQGVFISLSIPFI